MIFRFEMHHKYSFRPLIVQNSNFKWSVYIISLAPQPGKFCWVQHVGWGNLNFDFLIEVYAALYNWIMLKLEAQKNFQTSMISLNSVCNRGKSKLTQRSCFITSQGFEPKALKGLSLAYPFIEREGRKILYLELLPFSWCTWSSIFLKSTVGCDLTKTKQKHIET